MTSNEFAQMASRCLGKTAECRNLTLTASVPDAFGTKQGGALVLTLADPAGNTLTLDIATAAFMRCGLDQSVDLVEQAPDPGPVKSFRRGAEHIRLTLA